MHRAADEAVFPKGGGYNPLPLERIFQAHSSLMPDL